MTDYLRATSADRAAIIDFGNMVFSMAHRPHDFRTMIPKFYGDGKPSEEKTFLAKENGVIRAMVSVYERPLRIAGETLKVALIGSVASHPYDRGKGHMSRLLQMTNEDAAASGVDFMSLSGQRQRYGHYGYEPGMTTISFTMDGDNIRHCFSDLDAGSVTISEITDSGDGRIDRAFELYDRQPIAGMRTRENFFDTARTWHARLLAVEENGDMIGYIIDGNHEIVLEDEGKLPLALKAYSRATGGGSIEIHCAPHEVKRVSFLSDVCEGMEITAGHMTRVIRFERVVSALMKLKSTYARLADGRFALAVTGGERLLIEVKNGVPRVGATDETPDLILPARNAEMLLLSPSSLVLPLPGALKSWLPLPLFIPSADCF